MEAKKFAKKECRVEVKTTNPKEQAMMPLLLLLLLLLLFCVAFATPPTVDCYLDVLLLLLSPLALALQHHDPQVICGNE